MDIGIYSTTAVTFLRLYGALTGYPTGDLERAVNGTPTTTEAAEIKRAVGYVADHLLRSLTMAEGPESGLAAKRAATVERDIHTYEVHCLRSHIQAINGDINKFRRAAVAAVCALTAENLSTTRNMPNEDLAETLLGAAGDATRRRVLRDIAAANRRSTPAIETTAAATEESKNRNQRSSAETTEQREQAPQPKTTGARPPKSQSRRRGAKTGRPTEK